MNAREAAFSVLNEFKTQNRDLDDAVDGVFKFLFKDARDKRLAFEIIYGVLRHEAMLDYSINKYVSKTVVMTEQLMIILRIGAYQLFHLDKVPSHAAVSECVNLTRSQKMPNLSGVVNAILRKIDKNKKSAIALPIEMDRIDRFSLQYSTPKWLINRWMEQYGGGKVKKLLEYNNEKPRIYVRRNATKVTQIRFESDIASASDTAPMATGYRKLYYKIRSGITPKDMDSFTTGYCTVQAPSSGWVVALLNLEKGETVLDMSAAPGGKSTLIAEEVGESGMVIAADRSPSRCSLILDNAIRLGQNQIKIISVDGTEPAYNRKFKKILLDAPCSGTGVIQKHPDGRWSRKESEILKSVNLQRRLLNEAAESLEIGGTLVYATCSLEKEENQDQIKDFLDTHKNFELDSASDVLPTSYCTRKGYLVITPHDHLLDGMFAARLIKKS